MIGIDIVYIPRMESLVKKRGNSFMERTFSKRERLAMEGRKLSPSFFAGRFAAKEAMAKAKGLGIARMGLNRLEVLVKEGGQVYGLWGEEEFHLSISHHGDYAVAMAQVAGLRPPEEFLAHFPYPGLEDHKGSRGRVALVGGSQGMYGSVVLSSKAALRTGAGYSYILAREDCFQALALLSREVIVRSFSSQDEEKAFLMTMDAIGVGPGMGRDREAEERYNRIFGLDKGLVLDADGLFHLAKNSESLLERKNFTILTPHEGELARILGISPNDLHKNRIDIARNFAKKYACIVVLKGRHSLVTNGKEVYVNNTGNPGMATAGSGDVLTGIITALLGQGMEAFYAAKLGVYLHGLSGDIAVEELTHNGLIASDIIDYLPRALGRFY